MKNLKKHSPLPTAVSFEESTFYNFTPEEVMSILGNKKPLTFITDLCISGSYYPWAVYYSEVPYRTKGHEKYVALQRSQDEVKMLRLSEKKMHAERFQHGIICLGCNLVLRSVYRHDFHQCGCPLETFIDGGKDYLRYGSIDLTDVRPVMIDVLSKTVKDL